MSTDTIFGLGNDQMANQFQFSFISMPGLVGLDASSLSLRMDTAFDIPEKSIATYDIMYRGLKVTRPAMGEETEKTFTLEFRLDQNWYLYKSLNNWLKLTFDSESHTSSEFLSMTCSGKMDAFGRNNDVVATINFKGIIIKSLKPTTFDPSSNDPTRVTAVFTFHSYDIV